jgi:hypothetical protein
VEFLSLLAEVQSLEIGNPSVVDMDEVLWVIMKVSEGRLLLPLSMAVVDPRVCVSYVHSTTPRYCMPANNGPEQ